MIPSNHTPRRCFCGLPLPGADTGAVGGEGPVVVGAMGPVTGEGVVESEANDSRRSGIRLREFNDHIPNITICCVARIKRGQTMYVLTWYKSIFNGNSWSHDGCCPAPEPFRATRWGSVVFAFSILEVVAIDRRSISPTFCHQDIVRSICHPKS